jgi:predicted enzyme related to lactoylglutathione lyase
MSDGVTGLGGVFFRARDPAALKAWYEETLGVPAEDLMRSDGLVFAIFDADDETQDQEGVGRFGRAVDPEGNRFELWEPAEGM